MGTDDLRLSIGDLAAMTGISTDTIRAWEHRHRVLSPQRTPTRHRRYGMEDVEVLRRVRHNVAARGMSLKLAVAEAQGLVVAESPEPPAPPTHADIRSETEEAPWRAVADLLPNILCILDSSGVIIDANMAFARMAGVLRLHLRGMRLLELIDPGDRAKAARLYRPRPQRRRGWELNLRTTMLAGLFTFDSYVVPTMTGAFIVLVGRDLSSSGTELWPDLTMTAATPSPPV